MPEYPTSAVHGRRLWMYTGFNWIPVVYGAGQHSFIRSINIWNGAKQCWMVPTWGWAEWDRANSQLANIPSLNVYLPGRMWHGDEHIPDGGVTAVLTNPTYRNKVAPLTFTATTPNWVRLMHLKPRVDETWRIIAVGPRYPTEVPSTALNVDISPYDVIHFWPSVGVTRRAVGTDSEDPGNNTTIESAIIWDAKGWTDINITPPLSLPAAVADSTHNAFTTLFRSAVTDTAMAIDFQAIRKLIHDRYSEQDPYFTGAYDPISLMGTRRCYVHGRVTVQVFITGLGAVPDSMMDAPSFSIWANTNAALTPFTQTLSENGYTATVDCRRPASLVPSGAKVFTLDAADMTDDVNTTYQFPRNAQDPNGIQDTYNTRTRSRQIVFDFEAPGPGEDNLTLWASIDDPVEAGGSITSVHLQISLALERVSIHYADPGHDTPSETHAWNVY